ncbi:MAG: hypothetical protein RL189_2767 [Pseudomonadota bacterium]|jgi:cobalamin synthase
MIDYFLSGWSFFFRWPVANAQAYRPLGVFIGPLLQAFVFLVFAFLGVAALGSEMQHWSPLAGFVGLSMLTGFFHEDGLADTADSLGVSKFNSQESLEKIHSTFKDPRLGTFGVSALVLLWAFRILIVSHAQISLALFALVCLLSRATSLGLGLFYSSWLKTSHSARSSHVMQSVSAGRAALVLATVVSAGVVGCFLVETFFPTVMTFPLRLTADDFGRLLFSIAVMLVSSSLLFWGLVKRTEALNGDLLGALVCISEVFLTIYILKVF